MLNFANKMPITKALLFFSYLIAACGLGIGAGGSWMLFKSKDMNSFICGLFILIGSLFLAALIRMFADIGQIIFDLRVDIQNSSRKASALNEKLNKELIDQLQLQTGVLNQELQAVIDKLDKTSHDSDALGQKLNKELIAQLQLQIDSLNQKLQLQADVLNQELQAVIDKLDKTSHDSDALGQKLNKELIDQLQLQTGVLNQELQAVIDKLDKTSHDSDALGQKLNKELIDQLQLQTGVLNQELQAVIDKLDKTSHDSDALGQKLNKELIDQLQLQIDSLNQKLQLRAGVLNQGLQAVIDKLDKTSHDSDALGQKLNKELIAQLQLQIDSLNQKLQLRAGVLNQGLQAVIDKLDKTSHDSDALGQKLNKELIAQLQLQIDSLNQKLQLRAGVLNQDLQTMIGRLDKASHDSDALGQKLNKELRGQLQLQVNELIQKIMVIKDNFNQMNLNSKDMNQNIHQIRVFFEQIEKHLDLKK